MSNLELWEQVRSVPAEAQKKITGGRLSGFTDINPMWRIKKLTEQYGICGIGWYYEVIKKELIPCANDEVVATLDLNLYIRDEDEFMLHNCMDWCEKNCDRLRRLDNHSECWKKYFELKGKEELK